jgi:hypothetical protein
MRSDLLSKRLFFAGCLGLPWLWIVHILYWRSNEESNDQGILNPDDRKSSKYVQAIPENKSERCTTTLVGLSVCSFFVLSFLLSPDFSEEPTEASAEEIRMEAEKWVNRSKYGASVVVTVFVAWVIFAQVYRSHLPAVLYLYNYDNAELTGW